MSIELKTNLSQRLDGGISRLDRIHQEHLSESSEASESEAKSFSDALKNLMQEANDSQIQANHKMEEVVAGRNKDLHGAMLAIEKADIQFRLLTQVRNKVIDAYREIMRMQV